MFRKLVNLLSFIALIAAVVTAVMYFTAPEDNGQKPAPTKTNAVKIIKPIDLTGKWESVESKAGTKFIGTVQDNTVFVQMYASDAYTGLWYGTFDILQPGQNSLTSKAISDDTNHFVLSTAKTKDFIYQGESLVFDFSVMGTRTTVEMKRA